MHLCCDTRRLIQTRRELALYVGEWHTRINNTSQFLNGCCAIRHLHFTLDPPPHTHTHTHENFSFSFFKFCYWKMRVGEEVEGEASGVTLTHLSYHCFPLWCPPHTHTLCHRTHIFIHTDTSFDIPLSPPLLWPCLSRVCGGGGLVPSWLRDWGSGLLAAAHQWSTVHLLLTHA